MIARHETGTLPRAKRPPDYAVPALDRALDLLEALAASNSQLSLTDLSHLTKRTPGQLFRLLTRLEQRAYVLKDPASGRYRLTLKLFQLAHVHSPVEHLLRAANPPIRELAESVNESVHLSVLARRKLVVLMDVGSRYRIRFTHEVGAQFPAVTTNSGRLLLAHLPAAELETHLAGDPEYAELTAKEREALRTTFAGIRRRGYAISPSRERAGMKDIAVIVGSPTVGAVAALAIACLSGGKTRAEVGHLVREMWKTAAAITESLGLSYDRTAIL